MSPRTRAIGVALVACGILLAALPALDWYSADLPSGPDRLTGYGATGETWILPALGALLVVVGGLAAWVRPAAGGQGTRRLGVFALVGAGLGVAWAGKSALTPSVDVVAQRTGVPPAVLTGDWHVSVLSPAWITVAAAALAGMAAILLIAGRPDSPGRNT